MAGPIDPRLAQERLHDAEQAVATVYKRRAQEASENRRAYERFYTNLALFSGGTVALSITYMGYLQARPEPIAEKWLIVTSWISLLISLVCSLFQTFFYTHYVEYARQREHNQKRQAKIRIESEEQPNLIYADLHTQAEREDYKQQLDKAAAAFSEDIAWAKSRERLYEFLWVWSSRVAQLAFVIGLAFLTSFAVRQLY